MKIKERMKLYIWEYQSYLTFGANEGIAFALADSEEQAQDLIIQKYFKDHHEKEKEYLIQELIETIGVNALKQIGELSISNWKEYAKILRKKSFFAREFTLLLDVFKKTPKIIDSAFGSFLIGNDC